MYSALNIARYIIERCNLQGKPISNLKLQKILYFVQAEFLVTRNQPCFAEEIEAWDFGPVIPEVYHKYKIYGGASIPTIGKAMNLIAISKNDQVLINGMVDECAKYSASALVELTHNQTPWIEAYYSEGYNNVIPKNKIKEYFKD